jgi:Protein of unknown function (DUF2510)
MSQGPSVDAQDPDPGPPGWYPDREQTVYRYWDGQGWTDERAASPTPPEASPATDNGRSFAETLTAILGALTAIVALVVVPGAYAMRERLEAQNLPAELGVVASLPREFLLAIGLTSVFLPLVVMVGAAVVIALVPGEERRPNPALLLDFKDRRALLSAALLVGLSVVLIVGLPFFVDPSPGVVTFALAALTVLVWLVSAHLLLSRYSGRDVPLRGVALVTLLATVVFLAWPLQFASDRAELSPATACLAGGKRIDGYLIGQTESRIYIGETPVRIVVIMETKWLRGTIQGRLRATHVYDIRDYPEWRLEITTGLDRVDLMIADLEVMTPDELKEVPNRLQIIGYGETEKPPPNVREVKREDLADKDDLVDLVEAELPADSEEDPALRITSVPTSDVSRLLIGGLGACGQGDRAAAGPSVKTG